MFLASRTGEREQGKCHIGPIA